MKLTLMDWANTKTDFDIGELENIEKIHISVITGDEIAEVHYKDGTCDGFDSSYDRRLNYFDVEYDLYDAKKGINHLEDQSFINRRTSYDYSPEN